jgi:hypothetical protein
MKRYKVAVEEVPYPCGWSEFEVQAWIYIRLYHRGYDIHGEVTGGVGRFDLVIYDAAQRPQVIIETKRGEIHQLEQLTRDGHASVPVMLCKGPADVKRVIAEVLATYQPAYPHREDTVLAGKLQAIRFANEQQRRNGHAERTITHVYRSHLSPGGPTYEA